MRPWISPMLLSTDDVPIVCGRYCVRRLNGIGGRVCQGVVQGSFLLIARRTDVVTVVFVEGSLLESDEKMRGER